MSDDLPSPALLGGFSPSAEQTIKTDLGRDVSEAFSSFEATWPTPIWRP